MATYLIRAPKVGLLSRTFDSIEAAKKEANGFLLSRSRETGKIEIAPFAPGTVGGVGPPVLTGKRSKPGGMIQWAETAAETPDAEG